MNKISLLITSHILVLFIVLGLILYFSPLSFFAQDGYIGFGPMLAEFLRGDSYYLNSKVFFGGQNLLALYGYLPFWKVFRWLNFDFIRSLNLSLWVFWLFLYYFSFSIYTYFRKTFKLFDFYLLSFYVFTSPIIFNRLYAGHINLLFGLLPSFVFLQILIMPRWHSYVVGVLCLWFGFNFQGHQMLAYIPFYIPLYLIYFLDLKKKEKIKAVWLGFLVLIISFVLAYPTLIAMIKYAVSDENVRSIDINVVYSYSPMYFSDITNLMLGSINPFTSQNSLNYFHEMTFPIGIMFFLFHLSTHRKDLKIVVGTSYLVLILFCLNIPPFSLLSKIAFLTPFRVPQRSLIFFSYLIPLLVIAKIDWDLVLKDLVTPFVVFIFLLFFPSAEFITFSFLYLLCSGIYLSKKRKLMKSTVLAAALLLAMVNTDKFPFFAQSHKAYKDSRHLIVKAITQFKESKSIYKETFYIEGPNKVFLYATAKILGIKTMEGYGAPPKSLFEKYKRLSGEQYGPTSNSLYFNSEANRFKEILKDFGVTYILRIE